MISAVSARFMPAIHLYMFIIPDAYPILPHDRVNKRTETRESFSIKQRVAPSDTMLFALASPCSITGPRNFCQRSLRRS